MTSDATNKGNEKTQINQFSEKTF